MRCIDSAPQNRRAVLNLACLYFLLAVSLSLPSVSVQFQFVDNYGLRSAMIAMIGGIVGIPWVLKPVSATIGPGFFGIACVLTGLLSTLFIVPLPLTVMVIAMVLRQFGMVYLDVCIDGFMVDCVADTESDGAVQSVVTVAKTLGRMIGSLCGALIYHSIHDRLAFVVSAVTCFTLLGCARDTSSRTEPVITRETLVSTCAWLRERSVWIFMIFVVIFSFQPDTQSSMVYYMQTSMRITDIDFGFLRVFGAASTIASGMLFAKFGSRVSTRCLLTTGIACACTIDMLFCAYISYVPTESFAKQHMLFLSLVDITNALILNFCTMPVIVIATKMAARGDERTRALRYSLLTSIMNVCGVISEESGALIAREMFGGDKYIDASMLTIVQFMCNTWSMLTVSAVVWLIPLTQL